MFVLAHLSDPHLGPLPRPSVSDLAGKRVLGYLNWRRSRRGLHVTDVLASIVADVAAQDPSHIVVTGDLVNIAVEGEFAPARQWLSQLGPPQGVTLVPGNHDAYVRRAVPHSAMYWGDYMRGDHPAPGAPPDLALSFPFVRRRGPVAIVGLSTAIPTAPFMATGRLGPVQLQRLSGVLDGLARERAFRIVLIHHPPVEVPRGRFKRLVDSRVLVQLIAQHGAELILHGHEHTHSLAWIEGPHGRIPVVGVPSASASLMSRNPAGYNLYRIAGEAGCWTCESVSRGLQHGGGIGETRVHRLF